MAFLVLGAGGFTSCSAANPGNAADRAACIAFRSLYNDFQKSGRLSQTDLRNFLNKAAEAGPVYRAAETAMLRDVAKNDGPDFQTQDNKVAAACTAMGVGP